MASLQIPEVSDCIVFATLSQVAGKFTGKRYQRLFYNFNAQLPGAIFDYNEVLAVGKIIRQ
jgi:hypothetical protein